MRPTGTKEDGIKYLLKPECEAFMRATRRTNGIASYSVYAYSSEHECQSLPKSSSQNVNEGSFQILIQGKKGGTARHYTMSGKLWKKYRAWIRERAKLNHADMNPYLFITKYSMHDMPMAEQTVKNAFKKYAALAKLNGEFSVHSLRHTCAVMRIAEGTPVVFVQKWLRHKSINSTMIYVDIASPEIKRDEREAAQTFDKYL